MHGLLALALYLGQAAEAPPPPPSPPPLVSAPEGEVLPPPPPPLPPPGQPSVLEPLREPPPAEEPAPGTPTVWWKRSLATFGVSAGAGLGLGAAAGLLGYFTFCGGAQCGGSDLFAIFTIATLTATFTIPAAVSLVGRAMGGRARYGYALIGSALFGAAGLVLSIALTGGTDVPIVVIPIFSSLMVLGSVASFELFSFLKEPKAKAEPVISIGPGGGSIGIKATF